MATWGDLEKGKPDGMSDIEYARRMKEFGSLEDRLNELKGMTDTIGTGRLKRDPDLDRKRLEMKMKAKQQF